MGRILRPHIDVETKLRVLLRQMGDAFAEDMISIAREQRCMGALVKEKQATFAALIGCAADEIDYDHHPPLAAREKVFRRGEHVEYKPRANDPDYIFARWRGAHKVKMRVGQAGQYSDAILIKRNRRMERREQEAAGLRKPRRKAKIKSASRWPAKGERKINWRRKP